MSRSFYSDAQDKNTICGSQKLTFAPHYQYPRLVQVRDKELKLDNGEKKDL